MAGKQKSTKKVVSKRASKAVPSARMVNAVFDLAAAEAKAREERELRRLVEEQAIDLLAARNRVRALEEEKATLITVANNRMEGWRRTAEERNALQALHNRSVWHKIWDWVTR